MQAGAALPLPVFEMRRGGLYACDSVGVLEVGRRRIEILPKVDPGGDKDSDRELLFRLLSWAGLLPGSVATRGGVRVKSVDLVEEVAKAVANELAQLLGEGAPRRYTMKEEMAPVVKGRIDLGRVARRHSASRHLLPVRHFPLDRDNELSQLLRSLSETLEGRVRSGRTKRTLSYCRDVLDQATRIPLAEATRLSGHLGRYETQWNRLVVLAKALASGRAVDPMAPGGLDLFTFLFPLDHLFEEVLRRVLGRALASDPVDVTLSRRTCHLLQRLRDDKRALQLRPDYVFLERSGVAIGIGDAKWKRLSPRKASYGLSSSDAYQVATYMTRYGVQNGLLFFPKDKWMDDPGTIAWRDSFRLQGGAGRLTLLGIDVGALVHPSKAKRLESSGQLLEAVAEAVLLQD